MSAGQQAGLMLDAPAYDVRAVLLDPLRLPDWNPAFRSVAGPVEAVVGHRYAITVRPGLRGTFTYAAIGPDLVDTRWEVPGFAESGSWQLRAEGGRTYVVHGFTHTGPLSVVLREAYRGVAELRLARLAEHLAGVTRRPTTHPQE